LLFAEAGSAAGSPISSALRQNKNLPYLDVVEPIVRQLNQVFRNGALETHCDEIASAIREFWSLQEAPQDE
jgi:hypothetical protein